MSPASALDKVMTATSTRRNWTAALLVGLLLGAGSLSTAQAARLDAEAHFQEGLRLFAAENYGKAARAFEQAVEAAPKVSDYHLWLGRAYGRRAETISRWRWFTALSLAGKTRESFERAVELDGANKAALSDLKDFYLEAPGVVGGGLEKAEQVAARISALDPAAGERAWASILEKQKEYDRAEARLRKARELEPQKVGHILALASFLSRRERFEESDRLYELARERKPDSPDVWLSRAKALVRARRHPEQARALLERYLKAELSPDAEPRSSARSLLKEL